MSGQHEPLTAEERELAQRLARLGASAQPSSALDARILAAAGASAVAAGTGAPRRVRARWAVGFGLAASLALAVGVAWQLRPLPGAGVDSPEASRAAATAEYGAPLAADTAAADNAPAAEPAMQDGGAATTGPTPDPAPVPPPAPAEPEPHRKQATAVPASQAAPAPPMALSGPPPVAADAAAPSAFPAPPPAPPAPVADQPEASALSSGSAARTAAPQAATRQRNGSTDAAMESVVQSEAERLDRAEAAVSSIDRDDASVLADDGYDDEPPASADSPEVRKAWLARIRELVAEGREEAARASLAEFRRRYPQAPLPDDLRPLLD